LTQFSVIHSSVPIWAFVCPKQLVRQFAIHALSVAAI
jgi:hypothetical protein